MTYDALGDRLPDRVDLAHVATAADAHADVDIGEFVETDDEDGLVDFEAEEGGLDEGEGVPVHFHEAFALLVDISVCSGVVERVQ